MELGLGLWCDRSDFGFIQHLLDSSKVFYHVRSVNPHSRLRNGLGIWLEDELLAFELRESKIHPGKTEGWNVCLAEELPADKLQELHATGTLDRPDVMKRLLPLHPEFYLGNDPACYLPYLQYERVRELFTQKHATKGFTTAPVKALLSYLNQTSSIQWNSCSWEAVTSLPMTQREACSVITAAQSRGIPVSAFCAACPEYWVGIPSIVMQLNTSDFLSMEHHGWEPSDQQILILLTHIQDPDTRAYLLKKLSGKELLQHTDLILAANDTTLCRTAQSIDWLQKDEQNIRLITSFLQHIEADLHPMTAVSIVESLAAADLLFSSWWNLLNESVQVRAIMYCSNFPESLLRWKSDILRITQESEQNGNALLHIMLTLLQIAYHRDEPFIQQQLFFEAHHGLLEYIAACYSASLDVTHAIAVLLPKCFSYTSGKANYFCDAKPWTKRETVYCPDRRSECDRFHSMNLTWTPYRAASEKHNNAMELQSIADFIQHLSIVQTESFNQMLKEEMRPNDNGEYVHDDLAEYPYRIAAYVNRLIDMRPHMQCRCGAWFRPNFTYAKKASARLSATVFNCTADTDAEHDRDVYLNYCLRCDAVIDSRESKLRDQKKYLLCMQCGGSYTFGKGGACPVCGNIDPNTLEGLGKNWVRCFICGYDSRNRHRPHIIT